jgi:hypothetical protein
MGDLYEDKIIVSGAPNEKKGDDWYYTEDEWEFPGIS